MRTAVPRLDADRRPAARARRLRPSRPPRRAAVTIDADRHPRRTRGRSAPAAIPATSPAPATRSPTARPARYETFAFEVPDGTRHSRWTPASAGRTRRIDLGTSTSTVYRLGRPTRVAPALARGRALDGDRQRPERAVYAPAGRQPGRAGALPRRGRQRLLARRRHASPSGRPAECGIGPNIRRRGRLQRHRRRSATRRRASRCIGPDERARRRRRRRSARRPRTPTARSPPTCSTSTATASTSWTSDGMPEVSTSFATRGPRTVGVQVLDDSGAVAFATLRGRRSRAAGGAAPTAAAAELVPAQPHDVRRRGEAARCRDHLPAAREARAWRSSCGAARVGQLVRLIDRGVRKRNRYHRIRLRARRTCAAAATRCGSSSQAASGKRQVAQLSARRR